MPEVLSDEITARFGEDPERRLRENLDAVEARIASACARAGRARSDVTMLPVTKTVPAEIVRLAIGLGLGTLGENKVQEAKAKAAALADTGVRWNVIGHLQTNKVKQLVGFASEFQALDSLRLAALLQEALDAAGKTLDVFVQVNTSDEESKYGITPAEADDFLDRLREFPALRPRGLMTLAVLKGSEEEIRACFRRLRAIRDRVAKKGGPPCLLSMGMTGDFEAAIEEGADIVRVGQAIFGKRPTADGHFWPGLIK